MTLMELSRTYKKAAEALKLRMMQLREAKKSEMDPKVVYQLDRRMAELEPLLREARELYMLTAHYYDKGYHKNEKYTL